MAKPGIYSTVITADSGLKRTGWKGVTTTLCVDISESMAAGNAWSQVRAFVGSFLQGECVTGVGLLVKDVNINRNCHRFAEAVADLGFKIFC